MSLSGAARVRVSVTLAGVGALSVALLATADRDPRTISYSTQPVQVPSRQDAMTLEPDAVVERQIARREEHRYRVALTAGEYVKTIVEQRGIDVVVQIRGADDGVIAEFQDEIRSRGQEQAEVVAETAGIYTLSIRPAAGIISPGSYAIRLASRRAATDADRSMQEARTMHTTAVGLESAGKLDEARPLFERALAIAQAVRGPDDVFVGVLLFELAGNALEARNNAEAESLFDRSIAVVEKTAGPEHPYAAMARSRLALLQQRAGQGPKAEALLRPALQVIERTLGAEHRWFAASLMTQANLRVDAGDLEQGEAIGRRALAIVERIEETDSILYANLLHNLADIRRQKQDFDGAENLLRRSLVIGEKLRGPESYYVSTTFQNLGVVAVERKDYTAAEAFYMRALSIRERMVGPEHTDVAQLLNNLANVYRATGDHARSLQTYFRALRIWEQVGGPYRRGTLNVVGNIAKAYAAGGDVARANTFQRRADTIVETQLALNLAVGSERQRLAFVNSMSERTDRTVSMSLNEAAADPDAAALATLVLLQRKGRVLDAMTDTLASGQQRGADPGDRLLLDQLKVTNEQLARIGLVAQEERRPDERQNPIRELEARKERLEAELSERSGEVRARIQPVTLEAVQAAIPDDGVLLEFAVFRPFDPRAQRNAEAYGPPHYAAYVVRKHGSPSGRDLGAVSAIDGTIDALRQALRDPARTDVKERARALDEQVMRPLRASFGDAARVLVSPDGALNLVPFEALIDEYGCYLIERYSMSYLTSGRDLLRMQVPRMSRSRPVIVADPLFGEPSASSGGQPATRQASARKVRRSVTTGGDLSTIYFAPIGGTAQEARAIKTLFPEATLLTGRRATKATLQQVDAPRMLHIASHGFFLEDTARDTRAPTTSSPGGTRSIDESVNVENPLLRSGLALAGANLTHDAPGAGILTALEASSLNLWGTKLVTLSACDTGVGEVRNGEGVYGLRRAFVLAGAETLVMTLWPVSDYVTREPMAAFYAGLRAGIGRGDALRQAKLAMLKQPDRQHPFYWASFIQSGEWANLDGKR